MKAELGKEAQKGPQRASAMHHLESDDSAFLPMSAQSLLAPDEEHFLSPSVDFLKPLNED